MIEPKDLPVLLSKCFSFVEFCHSRVLLGQLRVWDAFVVRIVQESSEDAGKLLAGDERCMSEPMRKTYVIGVTATYYLCYRIRSYSIGLVFDAQSRAFPGRHTGQEFCYITSNVGGMLKAAT